jgi:hypothetical protein
MRNPQCGKVLSNGRGGIEAEPRMELKPVSRERLTHSIVVVIGARESEIAQIVPDGVAVFGIKRVVIDYIFHIVDCSVEFTFLEMAPGEIFIEVGQMPQGVFIPRKFLAFAPLDVFGAAKIINHPVHQFPDTARLSDHRTNGKRA